MNCEYVGMNNDFIGGRVDGFWYVAWRNYSLLLLNQFGLAFPGRFPEPRASTRSLPSSFVKIPQSKFRPEVVFDRIVYRLC